MAIHGVVEVAERSLMDRWFILAWFAWYILWHYFPATVEVTFQATVPPVQFRSAFRSLELEEFQFPHFTLTCDVSSGFYVRSLVHDIGEKLGVGASVVGVRRTRIGPYQIEQAKNLEEILGQLA